jgi:histidyl-tRNA synthetase
VSEHRKFSAVRGVRDILPPDSALWTRVENAAREIFDSYRFSEIRLPIFEHTELFARSIGVETDVVSKEMYTFPDRLDVADYPKQALAIAEFMKSPQEEPPPDEEFEVRVAPSEDARWPLLSLRPEATAGVVRAYIDHGMHTLPGAVKLYYIGPMFRRERPQKGRYRQFYQIGAEVLGQSDAPGIDAEVIEMLFAFFARIELGGGQLYVNSIGCRECRPAYVAELRKALLAVKEHLGADSQRRIDTNPLRVLDSKLPEEQAIIEMLPHIEQHLCEACRAHFERLQKELGLRGIAYEINWRLVRGLDYYMRTTFEITAPGLGSQNAICGGGRYDGLVELLGGPPTKGIGFAIGTDRVMLSLEEAGIRAPAGRVDVFVAWMGEASYAYGAGVARRLRDAGISVEVPTEAMKFKKSLGLAEKLGASYAVIVGEDEVAAKEVTLKRMADGDQQRIPKGDLAAYLKKALPKGEGLK